MVRYINNTSIKNKRVLLRADFDVSLNPDHTIANDARIKSNLPTIKQLLKHNNRLICIAKLNRPKGRDKKHSLQIVVKRLRKLLPRFRITLIDDFLTAKPSMFEKQTPKDVYVLENIRFYPEEGKNDPAFAKRLASLGDVFVNDGFAVSHRVEASVVGIPKYIPSYGGILLHKEIMMLDKLMHRPKKPFIAIVGGAKIMSKIGIIEKLMKMADYILLGGGLANPFIRAQGNEIGNSICEPDAVPLAKKLLRQAEKYQVRFILPSDVVLGLPDNSKDGGEVVNVNNIMRKERRMILDIGPESQAAFGAIIARAKTILWNGPAGLIENPAFRRGTDFIYYSIAHNPDAVSIVGGGDTLAAISQKEYLKSITHVSTGGGAMLEYIEKGTLPGIEVLKNRKP